MCIHLYPGGIVNKILHKEHFEVKDTYTAANKRKGNVLRMGIKHQVNRVIVCARFDITSCYSGNLHQLNVISDSNPPNNKIHR